MQKLQAQIIHDLFNPETPAETRAMLEQHAIETGGQGGHKGVRAHINTVTDPQERLQLLRQYHPEAAEVYLKGQDDPYYVIANPEWTPEKADAVKPLMVFDPSHFEAGDIAEMATSAPAVAGGFIGSVVGGFGAVSGPGVVASTAVGGALGAEGGRQLTNFVFDRGAELFADVSADRGTAADQLKQAGANIVVDSALGMAVDIPGIGIRRIGQKSLRTALRRVLKRKSGEKFQVVAGDRPFVEGVEMVPGSEKSRTLNNGDVITTRQVRLPGDGGVQTQTDITVNTTLPRTWFRRSNRDLKKANKADMAEQDAVMNSRIQSEADKALAKYSNNPDYPNARIIVQTDQTYEDIAKRGLMQMEGLTARADADTPTQFQVSVPPITRLAGSPALHAVEKTVGRKGAAEQIIGKSLDDFRGTITDELDNVMEGIAGAKTRPLPSTANPTDELLDRERRRVLNMVPGDENEAALVRNMFRGDMADDIADEFNARFGPAGRTNIPVIRAGAGKGAAPRKAAAGNILKEGLGARVNRIKTVANNYLDDAVRFADPERTASNMQPVRDWMAGMYERVGQARGSAPQMVQQAMNEGDKILEMVMNKQGPITLNEIATVEKGLRELIDKQKVGGVGNLTPEGVTDLEDLHAAVTRSMVDSIRESGSKDAMKALDNLDAFTAKNEEFRNFMREFVQTGGDREAYDFVMSEGKDVGKKLKTAMDNMPVEYQDAYRSSVIGIMGRRGPQGQDQAWNGMNFWQDYNTMNPDAKDILFGKVGDKALGGYRKDLDTLANLAKNFDAGTAYVNPTAEALNAQGLFVTPLLGGAAGYGLGGMPGAVAGIGLQAAGMGLSSKAVADLITNPEFVKWTLNMGSMKWPMGGKPPYKKISSQIARLGVIASNNPQMIDPISEYVNLIKSNLANLKLGSEAQAADWTVEKFQEAFSRLDPETQRKMMEEPARRQKEEVEQIIRKPMLGGM